MFLGSNDRLESHDLAVLDQVENEAVVVKYRIWGLRVFLQLLLSRLVQFIENPIRLPFERPLIHYFVVQFLFLERGLYFVIVEPEVFQILLHILLLH